MGFFAIEMVTIFNKINIIGSSIVITGLMGDTWILAVMCLRGSLSQ